MIDPEQMETDAANVDQEELEKQQALIRKLHNLPEPEKEEEDTGPKEGEKEDGITKKPKDPIPEEILRGDRVKN